MSRSRRDEGKGLTPANPFINAEAGVNVYASDNEISDDKNDDKWIYYSS